MIYDWDYTANCPADEVEWGLFGRGVDAMQACLFQ